MERRLLVAAGLSLLVLLAWEWIVPKPAKPPQPAGASPGAAGVTPAPGAAPAPSETSGAAGTANAATAAALPRPEPAAATAEESVRIGNDLFTATFSNRGGVLTSFTLSKYFDQENKPLELVRSLAPDLPRPFALDFGREASLTKAISGALFLVERPSAKTLRLRYADEKVSVEKEIRLADGYLFDVKVAVAGPAYDVLIGPGLRNPTDAERKSSYVLPASAILATTDGLKLIRPDKADPKDSWTIPARGWAGVEDNYFLEVLIPSRPAQARPFTYSMPRPQGKPSIEIATGIAADGTLEASAYFGPKDVSILESYGFGLERTVDFGWYAILARPLLWLMKKSYAIVPNWGVAILVVTFLIRLLLFPLTAKSYTSMKKMQKLAPKMNAIRDKYKKAKTDAAQRQKMNAELMALYQTEGYNPMSGCLPVLLQLPVLVAFYNVLSRTIELRHAPFVLWIKDLSAIDHTYVLVILMIVSMYAQQAMTPSTLDPTQKKIFMFMPVLWGFFLKDMPSGLVLYWLFSNLLTIVQQLVMNRIVKEDDPAPPAKGAKAKALKQASA